MLLDTASLYFRAFFGVPDSVRAPDGAPVNAVRGLLDFITRLVSTHAPSHLVACWDDDWRPEWRVKLIPTYKSHRVAEAVAKGPDVEEAPDALEAQVPVIREVLRALGIAVVGAPACEADDVIGTLTARATMPVDVVTGDRDLFQLVDDARSIQVLYTARGVGNLDVVDEAWVEKKYSIPGRLYATFAVLRGDPSDGLPGVPGVGDKTAAALVRTYGDLEGIVAAAADDSSALAPGLRLKIRQAIDYLPAAREVVIVSPDAELPEVDAMLPRKPVDPGAWDQLVERWGLGSSAERVVAALAARPS
nr:5'-3' exonuclease [Actinopolymorpha alba]